MWRFKETCSTLKTAKDCKTFYQKPFLLIFSTKAFLIWQTERQQLAGKDCSRNLIVVAKFQAKYDQLF